MINTILLKMIDFIIIRIVGPNKTERKNTVSSNLEIVKEKLSVHSVALRFAHVFLVCKVCIGTLQGPTVSIVL